MKGPRRLVSKPDSGFFAGLGVQARLLWRLIQDDRVNPLYKLLPLASFLYLIFPLDFFGPIDDALVIWLGSLLFIELSPPEVVQEHRAAIDPLSKAEEEETESPIEEKDIIDADFSE